MLVALGATLYFLYINPNRSHPGAGPTQARLKLAPRAQRPRVVEDGKYNVIILSVDALNASHLGCYGYPRKTSPHIDKFAERCFRFNQAISPAGWTVPSYASLMTGDYPVSHRVLRTDSKIPQSATLLSELLHAEGYQTAIFSEMGFLTPEFGIGQGFEEFDFCKERYNSERYDRAVCWLSEHRNEKWFMLFYTNDVHGPYQPPEPFSRMFLHDTYFDETKYIPVRPQNYAPPRIREEATDGIPHEVYIKGVTQVAYYLAQYDGAIRYTDQQMAKILDVLENEGLLQNTLVIFTADHGESMGEHERYFAHSSFFDNILRVPFIMYVPGLDPHTVEEQIQLVDVAPTILDVLHIPGAERMDGVSFLPLLTGERDSIREYTYAVGACWGMVRSRDYKLVIGIVGSNPKRVLARNYLYNLRQDPDELINLYDEKERVRELMEREFHGWLERLWAPATAPSEERLEMQGERLQHLKDLGYLR